MSLHAVFLGIGTRRQIGHDDKQQNGREAKERKDEREDSNAEALAREVHDG